jgi:hypothetical protein
VSLPTILAIFRSGARCESQLHDQRWGEEDVRTPQMVPLQGFRFEKLDLDNDGAQGVYEC